MTFQKHIRHTKDMEDKISARQQQAEQSFNELVAQKDQKQNQINQFQAEINDIDVELYRLQGEFRALKDLLEEKPEAKDPVTIDATPALKGKK